MAKAGELMVKIRKALTSNSVRFMTSSSRLVKSTLGIRGRHCITFYP
jgi:hypothetical protein